MINLRTKTLESFVMFKENKCDNTFTSKNFKNIKSLDLNPIDINFKYNKVFLEDLEYFPNLKYLTISNMHLDIASFAYILRLENLVSLTFISCSFQDLSILSNFKLSHIGFVNSKVEDLNVVSRVKNIKELTLIGYKMVDILKFIDLNLNYLELTNSTIKNNIDGFDNLLILKICNTNIMNLDFLSNLKRLKELYITNTQYQANKNVIDKLIKNKVFIYIDNNVLLRGVK